MARLCVPGFPFKKSSDSHAARFKTQPAFKVFPKRWVYRPNPETPRRSLLPASSPRSVRSFEESQLGSRLPVRVHFPRPTPVPSLPKTPTPRPSFKRPTPVPSAPKKPTPVPSFPVSTSSRLEERKAARQSRPRPWAQPRFLATSRSKLSTTGVLAPSKAKISATHTKSSARVDSARAKPVTSVKGERKGKPAKKCVRFGETTAVSVPRWIVRQEHVFIGPPKAMGHLQGWSVTPLKEPDEDGDEEKYVTYWGSDSYVMLTSTHASGPCDREGCAWNALAWIQAHRPTWTPEMIFRCWHDERALIRERGGFAL
ncbi:hypothetical protein BJX61DRAFT_314191 [Aspergillus egyptiacus]|nr:hypothetical protein BJX61DRAFT_314191 [Aspergillus egyptiacus]